MAYVPPPTPAQLEARQKAEEQRIKDKHDEKLEEQHNGGMGGPDRSQIDTPFMKMGIPELRAMILDSDPGRIYEVSQHWKSVHNILSGGDGDGKSGGVDSVSAKDSVVGMMKAAVENVLEHWEGEAAEAFRKKANGIMQKIQNGAAWANHNAAVMEAVQKDLRASKEKMRDVKVPSGWSSAWDRMWDDERDDGQLLKDINKGVNTDAAREANADSLSQGKEEQLKGVAIMEQLAVNYKAYSKPPQVDDTRDPFPAPPTNNIEMPPPISMPTPSRGGPGAAGSAPKPWSAGGTSKISAAPQVPRAKGITGGAQLPVAKTNVDSISPGLTGTGPSVGSGGIGPGGSGGGTGGVQGVIASGGPGLGTGARTGIGGAGRGGISPAGRSGIGTPGGRAGLVGGAGGAAAGRGTGGRAGMGGMGGGAGAGAAGRGGVGAGGRGALAKARGGVVGAAKAPSGKGAGTGAGLHGSRGGSQRGGMAGGMAGGMGRGNGRRSEEENSRGERPDYLVEDEETWVSEEDRKRNVPRNIE
ncbi:hypothetical protein ACWDZ4_25250 [Streptomyces sp. NPDC003016]